MQLTDTDAMPNNVLIIWMPSDQIGDERAYRDYILESLQTGVLVLPSDVTYEVMELPPLGQVEVRPTEPEPEAPPATEEAVFREHDLTEGAEKRAILQRLKDYREAHGRGCLDKVAKETRTRGRINDNTLRMLLTGDTQLPIEDWRIIGRALERLEAKEASDG